MVALMLGLGKSAGRGALELPSDQFLLLLASAVIGIAVIGAVLILTVQRRLGGGQAGDAPPTASGGPAGSS